MEVKIKDGWLTIKHNSEALRLNYTDTMGRKDFYEEVSQCFIEEANESNGI